MNYELLELRSKLENPFPKGDFIKVYLEKPMVYDENRPLVLITLENEPVILNKNSNLNIKNQYYVQYFKKEEIMTNITTLSSYNSPVRSNYNSPVKSNITTLSSSSTPIRLPIMSYSSPSDVTSSTPILLPISSPNGPNSSNVSNASSSDLNDIYFPLFNFYFGDDWVLTGSEAIKLYLQFIGRKDLMEFSPNDRDIFYLSNQLIPNKKFGEFQRVQSSPNRSMTFKYKELSFDVTIKPQIQYFNISGVRLYNPIEMLQDYEENIQRNNEKDLIKIRALKVIIDTIDFKKLQKMPQTTTKENFTNKFKGKTLSFDDV